MRKHLHHSALARRENTSSFRIGAVCPLPAAAVLRWQTVMAYPSDVKRNLKFIAYKNVSDSWLRSYDDILVLANKQQERNSVPPCPLSLVPADGVDDKTVLVEKQAQ